LDLARIDQAEVLDRAGRSLRPRPARAAAAAATLQGGPSRLEIAPADAADLEKGPLVAAVPMRKTRSCASAAAPSQIAKPGRKQLAQTRPRQRCHTTSSHVVTVMGDDTMLARIANSGGTFGMVLLV
jgi:hypothetical protein